ncbi:MAG: hypothetical protein FWD93_05595 [Coriobacteriia bacterium]|nr:hypothetical protein [Coriobacteriia bacterium]
MTAANSSAELTARADHKRKKSQRTKKRLCKGLLFCTVAALLLFATHLIMQPGHRPFDSWPAYNSLPENSVDVLVVGNSHAFATFAPMQLWYENSTTSWVLGSGSTTVEQRLLMLEIGLETQSPDVVLFELWIPEAEESLRPEVHTALYSQLPLSMHKIRGLLRDVPAESFWRYVIPLVQNHSRWDELTSEDFQISLQESRNVTGGARPLVTDIDNRDDIQFPPTAKLPKSDPYIKQQVEVLTRVRELSAATDTQLIFLFTPVADNEIMGRIEYTKQAIAQTQELSDVPVVDMNDIVVSQLGLSSDHFYDEGHLYLWGMWAATSWLYDEVISLYVDESREYSPEVVQWWDEQAAHWNEMQAEWLLPEDE